MSLATLRWAVTVAILLVNVSGCSYFQRADVDDDVDLAEIDRVENTDPTNRERSEASIEPAVVEGQLELKLKARDRFPLSKSIEHRLMQTDREGTQVDRSRTDMMMSLVVDDVLSDGRKQITVQYHRVQYQQEIRGKKIFYSSDKPSEPIPVEAMLYAGLANNGFSFWIGTDNKILNVIDFNDFLNRCLRNVPDRYKVSVRQQLEATKRDDGIANFIDDSIGLLPYSTDPNHRAVAVKEGTAWDLEPKHSESPIPMDITTRCILKELSKSSAEIILTGTISGSRTPVSVNNAEGTYKVSVIGGHCTGNCRVDRQTGLPTDSQIRRHLELAMELPDGQRIQQFKDTLSTITTYLSQPQKPMEIADPAVQQSVFSNAVGKDNHRRVVPAVDVRRN